MNFVSPTGEGYDVISIRTRPLLRPLPSPPNTSSSLFVRYVTIVNSSLPGYYAVILVKCFLMIRKFIFTSSFSRTLLVQQREQLLESVVGSSGPSVLSHCQLHFGEPLDTEIVERKDG